MSSDPIKHHRTFCQILSKNWHAITVSIPMLPDSSIRILAGVFYSRHCLDTNISNQSGSILGHSSLDTPLKLYRNRFFLFMLLRVRNSVSGSCIPFRFIPSSESLSLIDLSSDQLDAFLLYLLDPVAQTSLRSCSGTFIT